MRHIRLKDCSKAVEAGADEIDMVLSRGLFLAGRYDDVRREIRETRAACAAASKSIGRDPVHLKIILETGELGTGPPAFTPSRWIASAPWGTQSLATIPSRRAS